VNIAAVIYSGYKLLLEKHNNAVTKTQILYKIINCLNFFGKLNTFTAGLIQAVCEKQLDCKWLCVGISLVQ